MSLNGLIQLNTRKETIEILKQQHAKGYRYVVRDKEMPYLICFSIKPKRYRDMESWGYVDSDADGVMGAYPIKNTDITEIHFNNRAATLISNFLDKNTT